MKRKNLIIRMLVIVMMIGGMLTTKVNAADGSSFKASVSPTSKTIKPGEEITITVSVSDINMGENGINTLEGTLQYDKEIFESVTSSNVKSQNNWTTTYNDESSSLNGKFLAVNLSSGVKESTTIFSVTLKAKAEIKETKTTQINFKDITSNDGTNLVVAGTKTVNVTIQNEEKVDSTTPSIDDGTSSGEISSGTTTGDKTNQNTKPAVVDKTQSSTKLPNTGKSTIIITIIFTIILLAGVLAIKNKNMKDIK